MWAGARFGNVRGTMARPTKLDLAPVSTFLEQNPEWRSIDDLKLERTFRFPDFASALAFVVRIGLAAERADHHPDIELAWGRVKVLWTTHDAGGITALDLELARKTDALYAGAARG